MTLLKTGLGGFKKCVEPFLSMSLVENIILAKNATPELWTNGDTNQIEIMERTVIMTG